MKLNKILKVPRVNKVIKYFVLSDLMLFAGWGFVSPIFSIFIIEEVVGATLFAVGLTSAIYWIFRSAGQLYIAKVLDSKDGEQDDLYVLVGGLFFISLIAFGFVFVDRLLELYIIQAIHGVAMGFYSISWSAIFSRHLDKSRTAFDWSLDKTTIGIAVAITSLAGGWLATSYGFDSIFVIAGILSMAAAIIIFFVPEFVLPKPTQVKLSDEAHIHKAHIPPTTN